MSSAVENTLPDGWKWVDNNELIYVTDYVANGSFKSLRDNVTYKDEEDYAILVRLKDFTNNWNGVYKYVDENAFKFLSKSSLQKDDIVMCNVGSVGKYFLVPDLEKPMTLAPNSVLIRPINSGLDNKFLFYYYASKIFSTKLKGILSTTAQPKFNKTGFRALRMPIPPLQEQKRIVAKIDTLFAKIDKAISLTEESSKQAENLFTSSLSQIFDDLNQSYNSYPLMKYVDFVGGSQPPKSSFSYELKEGFIRLIQIRDYKTDNHIVYINKDSTKKFCEADDVMIGRYGPPVFQILRGIKGAYNVALMKAIPNESMVSKDFLFYFLQNSSIQNYIISISQRSAGQSGVNKKALEAYSIVLPPLDIQSKYVDIFNQLQKSSEETQSKLEEQLAYLKQLKSSILSKGFKGEL